MAVTDLALAAEIGGRFDGVLVDEYQDTNRLQAAILLALKPDGRGLTVVGDDAQSIYMLSGRPRSGQHPRFPGSVLAAGDGDDVDLQFIAPPN